VLALCDVVEPFNLQSSHCQHFRSVWKKKLPRKCTNLICNTKSSRNEESRNKACLFYSR